MRVMSENVIELKYALIQISSVFSPSIEQAASKPCSFQVQNIIPYYSFHKTELSCLQAQIRN